MLGIMISWLCQGMCSWMGFRGCIELDFGVAATVGIEADLSTHSFVNIFIIRLD